MMEIYKAFYESPIGNIEIAADNKGIISLDFVKSSSDPMDCHLLQECVKQLDEYFNGQRKVFDLPLNITGSDFQKKVWTELLKIPYGQTRSYGEIARAIGNEKASRAVGMANNRNNIGIIIPCHRVIGSNGSLTGYASGIWRKEWLLNHEKKNKI